MSEKSSSNRLSGGRLSNGRFARGNKFGRGNPFNKRVCALRAGLLNEVTGDDVGQIISSLVRQAKSGDVLAVRELLDRTVGSALHADLLKRVESLEQAVRDLAAYMKLKRIPGDASQHIE